MVLDIEVIFYEGIRGVLIMVFIIELEGKYL